MRRQQTGVKPQEGPICLLQRRTSDHLNEELTLQGHLQVEVKKGGRETAKACGWRLEMVALGEVHALTSAFCCPVSANHFFLCSSHGAVVRE